MDIPFIFVNNLEILLQMVLFAEGKQVLVSFLIERDAVELAVLLRLELLCCATLAGVAVQRTRATALRAPT